MEENFVILNNLVRLLTLIIIYQIVHRICACVRENKFFEVRSVA